VVEYLLWIQFPVERERGERDRERERERELGHVVSEAKKF
jgi:hypothetical protein